MPIKIPRRLKPEASSLQPETKIQKGIFTVILQCIRQCTSFDTDSLPLEKLAGRLAVLQQPLGSRLVSLC